MSLPLKEDSCAMRGRDQVGNPEPSKQVPSLGRRHSAKGWGGPVPSPQWAPGALGSSPDEHIPGGWRLGEGPAAVKHHFCVLQQERMSGANSMRLVLSTAFPRSDASCTQNPYHGRHAPIPATLCLWASVWADSATLARKPAGWHAPTSEDPGPQNRSVRILRARLRFTRK